jgi:hypothetical protein
MTATRRSVATLAAAWALVMLAPATPAHAHHGYAGPVRLYLETVRLETQGQQWHLRAGVNDSGTGKPAPGFVVDASGSGPQGTAFGPVHMSDVDADGRYDAALGALPAGDWSVTVNVTDAPGSQERAVPVTRTWRLALQPGPPLELVGRQTTLDTDDAASSSSSSDAGTIATAMALAGLAVLLALAVTLVRRRHRTPALPAS